MAGLVRRVSVWQILPGRPSTMDPKDAIEDVPWLSPWTTSPVGTPLGLGDQGFEDLPLFLSQVHAKDCAESPLLPLSLLPKTDQALGECQDL